jgi:peptidoglycan hydrolase CwlO-like protein
MYPSINEKEDRESLDRQLSVIRSYIENEIAGKQAMIVRLQVQLQELSMLVTQKDAQLELMQEKLAECQQNVEGQRQLMNKLLNDIGNYQRDILWYRRTYEQRSLVGILKDKFFGKSSGGANDHT